MSNDETPCPTCGKPVYDWRQCEWCALNKRLSKACELLESCRLAAMAMWPTAIGDSENEEIKSFLLAESPRCNHGVLLSERCEKCSDAIVQASGGWAEAAERQRWRKEGKKFL